MANFTPLSLRLCVHVACSRCLFVVIFMVVVFFPHFVLPHLRRTDGPTHPFCCNLPFCPMDRLQGKSSTFLLPFFFKHSQANTHNPPSPYPLNLASYPTLSYAMPQASRWFLLWFSTTLFYPCVVFLSSLCSHFFSLPSTNNNKCSGHAKTNKAI